VNTRTAPPFAIVIIGSLALVVSTAGCGGGGSDSCGNVQPCGGAPVGAWHASSACANSASVNQSFLEGLMGFCATASISSFSVHPTGTLTLNTDRTYWGDLALSTTVTANFPADCLMGATCADLNAAIQSAVGGDLQSASCAGSGSCACTMTAMTALATSATTPGTYATSGTTLTLTDNPGSQNGGPYCVQGNRLHLVDVDTSMPMATITSDVVLAK
jgi:hypothetical protein